MTEPTRDALHAETLAWLERVEAGTSFDDFRKSVAYAAECVTKRAELEAEVERLRALHHDLIYEVGTVTPGETRHESAKRMLRQHETVCGIGGPDAAATREAR